MAARPQAPEFGKDTLRSVMKTFYIHANKLMVCDSQAASSTFTCGH